MSLSKRATSESGKRAASRLVDEHSWTSIEFVEGDSSKVLCKSNRWWSNVNCSVNTSNNENKNDIVGRYTQIILENIQLVIKIILI